MARALRPRPAIVVAPVLVTQDTSPTVLGIDSRRYLDIVVPLCVGHVASIGKLRAIPVDIVLDRVRTLASSSPSSPPLSVSDDEQPESADGVLRALGLRMRRSA